MHVIAFTKVSGPYGWLGNMAPYPITYLGLEWRTSEALFQALRFDDNAIREEIRAQKSPMAAKMVAKKHADRRAIEPMSDRDVNLMRLVLRLKVDAHPQLKDELLATDDAFIVEDVTKRPNGTGLFWGSRSLANGMWDGTNCLGALWMELREQLRREMSDLVGGDDHPEVVG